MNSTAEMERWIMCPVCHEPNPLGTKFCHHCWGAAIHTDSRVLSDDELEYWRSRFKRRKWRKPLVVSLVSLTVLAAIVYSILFYLTDLVSGPTLTLSSSSRLGDWAMFRHDVSHSGITGDSGILPQGTTKWIFPTGGAIHSSAAIAGDTVYFGSRDGRLYAVDKATGEKRWEYQTGSWVESSPAVANGIVYFGSNDGKFYALDAQSGQKLWDFSTSYPISSSPAIAEDMVYFGADDYYVYALEALTGKKLWTFETGSLVKSPPLVAQGILYIGGGNEFFYALDALNGRFRLRLMSFVPVYSAATISHDTVYFGAGNGYVFAINPTARSWPQEHFIKPYWIQAWLLSLPVPRPPPQSGLLWRLKIGKAINSSPTVIGNSLYIGADDKLVAIDVQTPKKLWELKTGGAVESSPAIAGNTIYVGSSDGRLYAVDATTGKKLWEFLTKDKITTSPAFADGTVYIGSQDGNLYAIK